MKNCPTGKRRADSPGKIAIACNSLIISEPSELQQANPNSKNVPEKAFLEENEDFSLARRRNLGQPLAVPDSDCRLSG
jgi:hypothetical protein